MIKWIEETIHLFNETKTTLQIEFAHATPEIRKMVNGVKFISQQWKTLKHLRHPNNRKLFKLHFIIVIVAIMLVEALFPEIPIDLKEFTSPVLGQNGPPSLSS